MFQSFCRRSEKIVMAWDDAGCHVFHSAIVSRNTTCVDIVGAVPTVVAERLGCWTDRRACGTWKLCLFWPIFHFISWWCLGDCWMSGILESDVFRRQANPKLRVHKDAAPGIPSCWDIHVPFYHETNASDSVVSQPRYASQARLTLIGVWMIEKEVCSEGPLNRSHRTSTTTTIEPMACGKMDGRRKPRADEFEGEWDIWRWLLLVNTTYPPS